ncbi:hypothetical protein ACLB0R_01230 [Sphingomonas sp. GlSt437]|uniref:hypothetical protein n=1 Tax=Sphingomonas sp. GlSt437 TaxID=3389970 RepID=UPI003A83638A
MTIAAGASGPKAQKAGVGTPTFAFDHSANEYIGRADFSQQIAGIPRIIAIHWLRLEPGVDHV